MSRRMATVPGIVLIALAATMWGTDALFRRPLAQSTSATTIVFGEHVILVAGGDARVIRRRETVDDLLAVEA